MKKLAVIVLIIILGVLAYFKYVNYKRFHPPSDYEYTVDPEIDVNYHDPMIVQQYFANAYEIGNFARQQWHNHKIDVKFVNDKKRGSQQAGEVYERMVTTTKYLEQKLLNSKELKGQGLDNAAIKYIEESGISAEKYKLERNFKRVNIASGDKGEHVSLLQTKLHERGYELTIDGSFNLETKNAILKFQIENGLVPTGVANEDVLLHLFEE